MYVLSAADVNALTVLPLSQAETIPAHWYRSPEHFMLERDLILCRNWQYVGHRSQVQSPGDFIVDEVLGRPLIIVHGANGQINCFFNVCRHRGGPLAIRSGNSKVLRCLYHAWAYNLDGKLIGTPRFDGVENFSKEDCHLERIRLEEYEGFFFVDLSGKAPPLEQHLAGIREQIAPINLHDMVFHRRVTYEINCNWKVYIDNFMEGYHIHPIHPELARMLDTNGYTTTIQNNKVLQYGPFSGNGGNIYQAEGGAAYYYQIFPNFMLNILPGRIQLNSILPIDVQRTSMVFDYFYTERDIEKLNKLASDDDTFSDLVQRQDVEICELVQKGLNSGSYDRGRLSVLEEKGVHGFQNMLRDAYRARIAEGAVKIL